jgi:hypothetical protein
VLPVGGRGRGDQVRRNGAEDRERRPDDQRRPSSLRAIVRIFVQEKQRWWEGNEK